VTHPLKRLQHLAGRFLLQFLCPGFPYELIRIADTAKPYLPTSNIISPFLIVETMPPPS
jgi:hypothetical protein